MKKNILITGSTDGIGKLTAIKLAKEGHKIYVHGRNSEKLSNVISEIKTASKNENVFGFVADFSDLDSVKQMAEQIKTEVLQIDVLVNNAGIFFSSDSHNKDGFDTRFVVNYLAPYLLTNELLPLVRKTNEPRIINLSSAAQSPISYNAMVGKDKVSENGSYAMSKLALTMWSNYLAKKCKGITVIAVNPGSLLNTKMANEAYGTYWSPAEKGVEILYDLAISDQHKSMTGKYFDNDNGAYAPAHSDAYNEAAIEKLIEVTENLLKG